MADTYAGLRTTARLAASARDYTTAPIRQVTAVMTRDYAANFQYGGDGDASDIRPLVGLLHPPGRRGNRAPT